MKNRLSAWIFWCGVLGWLAGCSDPVEQEGPQDVGVDAADDATSDADVEEDTGPFVIEDPYELVPFQNGVDSQEGHPEIEAGVPGAEEVRVGRIASEDTGFSGVWSHCRRGDFLFTNSRIKVCVQNETSNRYETYTGGKLMDARRHDQPPGEDVLDMVLPLLDFGTASADTVEVVRDGSDGVAVLRVTGSDIDLAHLTGALGMPLGHARAIRVQTEYRLYPDSVAVEMVTVMHAPAGRTYSMGAGDWFAYGDRGRSWSPGSGFGVAKKDLPWIAGFGDGHSYGLVFEDVGTPMGVAESQGIPYAEIRIGTLEMTREDPAVMRRWFVVGDGSLDSVRRAAAELRGEPFEARQVSGRVTDSAGNAVEGAEIVVRSEEVGITVATSDDEGEFDVWLEPGSYDVEVSGFAGPLSIEQTLQVDEVESHHGEADLVVPEVATLRLLVSEATTAQPLSSRVQFFHETLGSWHDYAPKGVLEARVPAGEVRVVVTRGMEYSLFSADWSFEGGGEVEESVILERGLDTQGWRGGDFHQHMEPSVDSETNVYTRVLENVSQGVDLMVPTDHEVVTDLQPVVDALGLGEEISTFPGLEISPLYAHFNIYPVHYQPDERGRGSIPLAYRQDREVKVRRMPEIIEIARQMESDPVVQMNHARNSSGMLNHVNFDPELGPEAVTHEDFTIDIDTIEVINRYDDICQIAADWSGLLNAGLRITGLGNSDTHRPDGEAGAPRNYMRMDVEPGEITAEMARQALRSGRVSVASQAFIDFTDGTTPGDEVQVDSSGTVSFDLRVQTPDWSRADKLLVIVNGRVVQEIDGTAALEDWVDFEETIDLEVENDSWVVFWASGPRTTAQVASRREVIAFTNPVYLVTGDGDWQAPGVGPLDLAAIDRGFCD